MNLVSEKFDMLLTDTTSPGLPSHEVLKLFRMLFAGSLKFTHVF